MNEEQSIPPAVYPFLNFQLSASHTTSTGRPFDGAPLANSAITHAYFSSSEMAVLEIRRSAGLPGSGINETVRFALVQLFAALVVDDEDDVGGAGFGVTVEVELRRAVVLVADDELDPPQAPSATMSTARATPPIPRTADVDFIATSASCQDPFEYFPHPTLGLSSPIRSDVTVAKTHGFKSRWGCHAIDSRIGEYRRIRRDGVRSSPEPLNEVNRPSLSVDVTNKSSVALCHRGMRCE